jgi:hypothetical protein
MEKKICGCGKEIRIMKAGINKETGEPYDAYYPKRCYDCYKQEKLIEKKEVKKWEQKMQEEPTEQEIEAAMTKRERELLSEMNSDKNIPIIDDETGKESSPMSQIDRIEIIAKEILDWCKAHN